MAQEIRDIRAGAEVGSRTVQLVYNWYAHEKGDMFGEFTVGFPADPYDNPRFPNRGKVVADIEIKTTPNIYGIVTFDDGSQTVQHNINSWSTISEIPKEDGK